MAAHSRINAISICSGIGGLDRGVARACPKIRVVLYVEREVSAAAVLAARMRDGLLDEAAIWSDLGSLCGPECRAYLRRAIGGGQGIDAVFGGIPCQPHSVAGKKQGAKDDRDLWPVTLAALERYKPWLFFLENVPNMLGYVSEVVVPDLRWLGYIVPRPVLLEAAGVGSSQKRERLFLLAYRRCERAQAWLLGLHGEADQPTARNAVDPGLRCDRIPLADDHDPRQHEPARDEQELGGRSGHGGEEIRLAGSPKRGRGSVRQPSGSDGLAHGDNGAVEDATSEHGGKRKRQREPTTGQTGSESGTKGSSKPMVSSECGSVQRRGGAGDLGGSDSQDQGEGDQRQRSWDAAGDHGTAMGGTLGPFPPGPGFGLDRVVEDVLGVLETDPGRGCDRFLAELAQWAAWQRILNVRPDLAPAISEDEQAAIEPKVCGRSDGISSKLDGDLSHANATEKCSAETMRTLRRDDGKKDVQRTNGGLVDLRQEEILQSSVHGWGHDEIARRIDAAWALGKGSLAFEECMRAMRDKAKALDSPLRQELEEQLSREPDYVMQFLSHQAAPRNRRHREEADAKIVSDLREAICADRFTGINVLKIMRMDAEKAIGVSRADQLRAYGNGVVSLQAAVAFRILVERLGHG